MRVREAEAYASKAGGDVDGRNLSRTSSGAEVRTATGGETKPEAAQGLLEAALERSNMMRAYQRVVENEGAPGVDGLTVLELKPWLMAHWETIKQALLAGEYMPRAVRKVEIPKPQGGVRILGIPCVQDRLIQQALHQTLQPLFEPGFSESSYGFRPGRNAHQAVQAAREYVAEGRRWTVDLDLEKFFDRVNHDVLMARVRRRVKDAGVLKLIRRYLQAGMMEGGITSARTEGTPQGSPLSPLLSNILLDDLDRELEKRGHRFCRYADDCNIYVKSERSGQRVRQSITAFLGQRLQLKVNAAKSAVARPWERKFLGYSMTWHRKPKLKIAPESRQRLAEKIRLALRRGRGQSMQQVIKRLNPVLRGWMAYFGYCETPSVLKELDAWIRRRLRCVQWKQWKTCKGRYKGLRKLGIEEPDLHILACCSRGAWPISDYSILRRALPCAHFDALGLPRLLVLHRART